MKSNFFSPIKVKKYNTLNKQNNSQLPYKYVIISCLPTFFAFLIYFIMNYPPFYQFQVRQMNYDNFSSFLVDSYQYPGLIFDYMVIHNLLLMKNNFSNCNTCNFMKRSNVTSTSNDLAISVLFGNKTYNIVNWVRTLRSTGCQCKILLLHEEGFLSYLNSNEKEMLEECGTVFWPLNRLFFRKYLPRTTRLVAIQLFLEAYGNYFNRVLVNDAFDTIFQKDPFVNDIPQNKVAVSIERVQYGNHESNMKFIQQVNPNLSFDWWRTKWILNGGFLLGDSEKVLKLYQIMSNINNYLKLDDQALLNYAYYTNMTNDIWVDFEGRYFISSAYSTFNLDCDLKGFMHENNFPQFTPHVLHQFDRICPLADNLLNVCPKMGPWHRYPTGRINSFYMHPCDAVYNYNHPPTLH